MVESRFILPEFQSDFRNSHSCIDNLMILTNHIQFVYMRRVSIVAAFLDSVFDNVIFGILFQELEFPVCACKFENLLAERLIYFIQNGEISKLLIAHKDILQASILSLLLFNIYLRNISRHLHRDIHILQYANNIVLNLGAWTFLPKNLNVWYFRDIEDVSPRIQL